MNLLIDACGLSANHRPWLSRGFRLRQWFSLISLSAALLVVTLPARAGSATWNLNPTNGDWNTAANWTPATIPSSETDVATLVNSNVTSISCGDASGGGGTTTIVGEIVFAQGAGAYTVTVTPVLDNALPSILEIWGQGITNDSGMTQNLVALSSGTDRSSARIYFMASSSAGENVVITNEGGGSSSGDGVYGAFTSIGFQPTDTASAGEATFINKGARASGTIYGGFTDLTNRANAESATFINEPGAVPGAAAGHTYVVTSGNIGNSTFIAKAASVAGAEGGWTEIDKGTAAGATFTANGATSAGPQSGAIFVYGGKGYATFTGNGGRGDGAGGGLIDLFALPNSAQTLVIAKGGKNGGLGGQIVIEGKAVVDQGQFQLLGSGLLDLSQVASPGTSIGSLAGNGMVTLGRRSLSVGNNNLDTTFSGVIQDRGAVSKVGSGTLTVAGASSYTGATTVESGMLIVTNKAGSATGNGSVTVNAGTLGGSGIISGAVTVGTSNGPGAVLAPATGTNKLATLTIQKAITFQADGAYTYSLQARGRRSRSDLVIAKGVTIESGAQFNLVAQVQSKLRKGTSFTVLSNTAGTLIDGTFSNLPDGAILSVSNNHLQASYEGGDGNDLTFTVVP